MSKMDNFFHPTSIAVIGASNRKIGDWAMRNLIYGYKGKIFPVNPNYKELHGLRCYSKLEEIPCNVDLAIILAPAAATPSVLEACDRKGIYSVMIQTAGFAEVGEKGTAIQNSCKEIAQEAGIRIWGPNCMGLIDVPKKHIFSFMSPRIYEDGLIPGKISLIVQSGILSAAFITELMARETVGIGKVCSIGNKADVDESDLMEYLLEDSETDVIALYMESITRGRLFVENANRATKPIVVLKGGKSKAGARAAMSHTASLSGNSVLTESILQMSGVVLANDIFQMVDLAKALALTPDIPSPCRVAIITTSGGLGILCCDLLEKQGLGVAQLSENTKKALRIIFPDWLPVENPVDLFVPLQLHGRLMAYYQSISVLLEDPGVDSILVNYVTGLEDEYLDLSKVKKMADKAGKGIIFCTMGRREASRSFRRDAWACGIQVYEEISRAVECLAAAVRFKSDIKSDDCVNTDILPLEQGNRGKLLLSPNAEKILDEYDSKQLLSNWGIPVVDERLVPTMAEAKKAAQVIGYPVVLKGLPYGKVHKSELGLLYLGIINERELEESYLTLENKIEGNGRILIQRQVKIDYELIAGFIRDDQFGPCIMFGLGGILCELQPDVVFALAPIRQADALKLINRIRGRRLLEGFRGMAPLRKDAMAAVLANLSHLGAKNPQIQQIDINPIAVIAGNSLAIDSAIVMKSVV